MITDRSKFPISRCSCMHYHNCHDYSRYEQLLSDCHSAYFSQRSLLMRPSVTGSLNDLSSTYVRDHCALTRSACSFLLRVCHDEWQLYHQFFASPSEALEYNIKSKAGVRPSNAFLSVKPLPRSALLCAVRPSSPAHHSLESHGNVGRALLHSAR